ncbi:MAG: cupredoxin domain-containing protein [Actinobacteria bacterium]|nr:cupredoxin domain-containing protein [Actinomycetota bacterium]MCB9390873.1 cupredoxin domain-containing protein [Acidimicrobiia bacterium]
MKTQRLVSLCTAVLAAGAFTACTDNDSASGDAIEVTSTNDECIVSVEEAPSGTLTFNVSNEGDKPTEFYLLGSDEQQIVGEVENIGPGLERKMVVTASEGDYFTSCKPGMTGDGIKAPFTVTHGD